ncbi:hypothetical protein BU25DRAFT_92118 [Macroventuria anomochaeta]|uniref:Uncharacterized protein n=1 Tax=Macroventuria anomochaeta TaxID=301207 RepID=A0ACB6RZQ2_9PLEO|nr:uncharacterized protein BU25DRAFT_92118 [Macroventuria anomochaeta]KAF2626639.1 hypothetical protein BU25DRAFT_92118 [Macroventuria anomochaeta]
MAAMRVSALCSVPCASAYRTSTDLELYYTAVIVFPSIASNSWLPSLALRSTSASKHRSCLRATIEDTQHMLLLYGVSHVESLKLAGARQLQGLHRISRDFVFASFHARWRLTYCSICLAGCCDTSN